MTLAVAYPGPVRRVRLRDRPNRYLARVTPTDGGEGFEAHVPNPGRMEELMIPGETEGWVSPAPRLGRKTRYDLISVYHGRTLVSVDSRVGNRMARVALAAGRLSRFGPGPWRPEVAWGRSRLDFAAGGSPGRPDALLEVKCSNLAVDGVAMFPDAPTVRGARHLGELTRAARRGIRAGVLIVVQRDDPVRFRPNAALDPVFARAFRRARAAGVVVRAQRVRVFPDRVEWDRPIPVLDAARRTSL